MQFSGFLRSIYDARTQNQSVLLVACQCFFYEFCYFVCDVANVTTIHKKIQPNLAINQIYENIV
jgi:hypothetical protein